MIPHANPNESCICGILHGFLPGIHRLHQIARGHLLPEIGYAWGVIDFHYGKSIAERREDCNRDFPLGKSLASLREAGLSLRPAAKYELPKPILFPRLFRHASPVLFF